MTFEAWFTVGTIALVIVALISGRISVDVAMVGGLTILLIADTVLGGILSLEAGIRGFAHPAIVMIGSLFVVAAGLQETGAMEIVARHVLGRPRSIGGAQLRMMVPVAVMSGFMNNTPIVAMYLPIIGDWARKLRVSPSKLFMPLSFAAILGGKISLIGTASNIVLLGLYLKFHAARTAEETAGAAASWLTALGVEPLSSQVQFWGVAILGVPTSIVGIALIRAVSPWLLPERRPAVETILDARRYQLEMLVRPESPIIGRSIEDAGLRHLPGLFLTQIDRGGLTLPAVGPEELIQANDILVFAGILDSVVDLRKIKGLVPATDQVKKIASGRRPRTLVEAVIARNSPLVGQSVRAAKFRTKYNAAIIAVHRRGERIQARVGDIVLRAGDTLLLETHAGFVPAYRNSDDFHLVSQVEGSHPVRHERAGVALAILGLLVVLLTLTPMHPVVAALLCAGLMVGSRCVTGTGARASINWQVLLVIGAALGLGASLTETGAADAIAHTVIAAFRDMGPHVMLLVAFCVTAAFAQLVTNNGAAVLMFPITMSVAADLGVSPEPFLFTLMVAAGSTFLSPLSYQTNLMVYGAGGYRFLDFARLGLPLTIAIAIICTVVAPLAFPFAPVAG